MQASRGTAADVGAGDSPVVAQIVHAFGSHCGTGLRDAVLFADASGEYLAYAVGRYICFRHLPSGEKTYVVEGSQVQALTAVAASPGRDVLAVAARLSSSKAPPQVSLFNLKADPEAAVRQPVCTLQDLGQVGEIKAMALSFDPEASRVVLASQLKLVVVDWRENVVVGRFDLGFFVDRLAFSPQQDGIVSASGGTSIQLWALPESEGTDDSELDGEDTGEEESLDDEGDGEDPETPRDDTLRALAVAGLENGARAAVADHAWLDDRGVLVAVTQTASVIFVLATALEEPRVIKQIEGNAESSALPRCLKVCPNGFLVGCTGGQVLMWGRPLDGDAYSSVGDAVEDLELVRSVAVAEAAQHVTGMDLSEAEGGSKKLVVGFGDGSINTVDLRDLTQLPRGASTLALGEPLDGGCHAGPILGADLAVHRPLAVTLCRAEGGLKFWNLSSWRREFSWDCLGEEPTAVALNPFGFLVAVAFADRLRISQVLVEELKPLRDVGARGVRMLRFSNGGSLLVAVQSKLVLVYSTVTWTKVALLRGHAQPIASFCFSPDDRTLTTCGEDGQLIEWNTAGWSKAHEHTPDRNAGAEASVVTVASNGLAVVALEEAGRVVLRTFRQCTPEPGCDIELPARLKLTSLCCHEGRLGTSLLGVSVTGSLWVCTGLHGNMGIKEIGLCSRPCTDLRLSADASFVQVSGEDGALFVLRLHGLTDEAPIGYPEGDVVMMCRAEIQEREDEIQQLAAEAANLKVLLVEDATRMQAEFDAKVAEARKQDQAAIKELRTACDSLQQQATAQERDALREMKAKEAKHVTAADSLEATYDAKIMTEADRFRVMEENLRNCAEKLVALREDSLQQLEHQRLRHRQELQRSVGEKDQEVQKMKDLIAFSRHRFDTMLDQEAMEQNLEMSEITGKSQEEQEQQKTVETRLKKDQDTIIRSLDMMEKGRERAAQEQYETSVVVRNLSEEVEKLQKEVTALKVERKEREATLREKELEIGSYKSKVNTLKKFKHVLDFRLHEVTLSLQPKDETIAQLSSQLKEMESEFEQRFESNKELEVYVKNFGSNIDEKLLECRNLRTTIKEREKTIRSFQEDVRNLATNEQDIRKWPMAMLKIHQKHMDPERLSKDMGGPALTELERQIKVTEKKAGALDAKDKATEEDCQRDIRQKVEENFGLIRELDKLRKERKDLYRLSKDLELKVMEAEKADQREREEAKQAALEGAMRAQLTEDATGDPRAAAQQGLQQVGAMFGVRARAQATDPMAGKLRRAGSTHRLPEERQQMQKLLAAADQKARAVQMKRLEGKLLKDQLDNSPEIAPVLGSSLGTGKT